MILCYFLLYFNYYIFYFKELNFYETPSHMLSAIVGEASQVLVRNPFELVKQNMQLGKYTSVMEAINDIFKNGGIKGLYRGYLVTVMREVPFGLIQYPLYEICKKKFVGKDFRLIDICISGAIAGGVSAFLTCPIDVIKTRIMTSNNKENYFSRFLPTFKSIYNDEGISKLFSGVSIRVFYITIGGMIFFGTNEYLKNLMNYQKKE
jgi:solute carrier family 25 S-adenosylmethionine transporter 26